MASANKEKDKDKEKEKDKEEDSELRSKSLTSVNTLNSIGFPDLSDQMRDSPLDDESYSSSSDAIPLEPESHTLPKDVICLLVVCEQHQTVAFKQIVNDCYFLPTFQFDGDSQSLSETVRNVVSMHDPNLLNDDFEYVPRLKLVDLYRAELLKSRTYVQRYIFQMALHKKETSSTSKGKGGATKSTPAATVTPCICSVGGNTAVDATVTLATLNRTMNSEDTVWIALQAIPANIGNIWGGEPLKIQMMMQRADPYRFSICEVDSSHPLAILERAKDTKDWLAPMIASIRLNLPKYFDASVSYLYNEFVVQGFPSNSMGFASFGILLDKLGLFQSSPNAANELRKRLFRALDCKSRHFIDFEDLCVGLIMFESNNDMIGPLSTTSQRQDYIFRYYDANEDGRLDLDDYKHLISDCVNRSMTDEQMKRLKQTKLSFCKEMLDTTWEKFVLSEKATTMSLEQYKKAFEHITKQSQQKEKEKDQTGINWWLLTAPFFEQIYVKFNCRNFATTPSQIIIDKETNYNRCEECGERKFMLSSSLIQLSDIGNILKIFHLKATQTRQLTQIDFVEEFKEGNVLGMANEFLIRIEKIGMTDTATMDQEEEENAKNYFFPTRHKMLKYLHLLLEYAKPLIEQDAKVVELSAPCFVFGDLNGSLKDLLRFSQTVFRSFPFIDASGLLFLGNYTDADSAYNLECLIYLICLKILSPTRVFLLRGANELAGRQQIQMQDRDKSDEPLNDIVCNLLAQIFDSFPIAAVIEESIYASHSGIPRDCSLTRMKIICEHSMHTKRQVLLESTSVSSLANDDLMEDLLQKVIIGEPTNSKSQEVHSANSSSLTSLCSDALFSNRDLELFISSSKLFCAIRSHQEFKEEVGYQLNDNFNLATIVSSSKVAKVPVCIFISYKSIRMIRLDPNY